MQLENVHGRSEQDKDDQRDVALKWRNTVLLK